jgi:serine/threonine protein kinase
VPDATDRVKAALADRYTIERELGAGGMATVYLAEDLKHHRRVAVKVLRPELTASIGADRFLREIEIAAQLQHPHIVPLYDSGQADFFLYYVMPRVEGESLREKLSREGELTVAQAVRVLWDVVDALGKAHSSGIVHRDIKPDNIMLSDRHALVTDFGVARAVNEAAGQRAPITGGIALGTPAYMAPEQAAGDPNVDHRADIYAVGTMAYEMLVGRPPFTGATSQMVVAAHLTQKPEPVRKHRPSVPHELSQLVMKCLEKDPADRWQSAEELLTQLEMLAIPTGGIPPTHTRARLAAALADGYAIERELGPDWMVTVYLAEDLKHERRVAIKVVRAELAAALSAERFLDELKLNACPSHPHILPLLDSGEADGFLYYVEQAAEGAESLRDRLNRERQLPVDDALRITLEVADVLGYAHSHGVVHRDITPENILLEEGHAVVAAFGIVQAVLAAGGSEVTEIRHSITKPAYMSPEQARREKLDGRCDIYSLACVLYEMLAGEPPFTGPKAQVILARHAVDPVPSLRAIRDVPRGLERRITKALAKAPANRFATAQEFREALLPDTAV